jgi:hypothetical protein
MLLKQNVTEIDELRLDKEILRQRFYISAVQALNVQHTAIRYTFSVNSVLKYHNASRQEN